MKRSPMHDIRLLHRSAGVLMVLIASVGCSTESSPQPTPETSNRAGPREATTDSPLQNATQASQPLSSPGAAPSAGTSTTASFLGLSGPKPATWIEQPPTSRMRAAQYLVPGTQSSDAAHVIVFFFGQGQGGDVTSNIDRWQAQFRGEDGSPVEPIVSTIEADGMPVTLVELHGAWQDMGAASHKPGVLFLAAIVEAPIGNVFIRFVGPTDVVNRDRPAFLDLIHGLKQSS